MKRILLLFMCFVLVISGFGCSSSNELPEGIEHREFYNSVLTILQDMENDLNNNQVTHKFLNEQTDLVKKLIEYNKNKELNEKEGVILFQLTEVLSDFELYMGLKDDNVDYIDTNSTFGKLLYKSLKMLISDIGINYDLEKLTK